VLRHQLLLLLHLHHQQVLQQQVHQVLLLLKLQQQPVLQVQQLQQQVLLHHTMSLMIDT
jgi:hypothetical protein